MTSFPSFAATDTSPVKVRRLIFRCYYTLLKRVIISLQEPSALLSLLPTGCRFSERACQTALPLYFRECRVQMQVHGEPRNLTCTSRAGLFLVHFRLTDAITGALLEPNCTNTNFRAP